MQKEREDQRPEAALHADSSWFGLLVERIRSKWRERCRGSDKGSLKRRRSVEELEQIHISIRGDNGSQQNNIVTSKYTWYNFVFLATLLQFRRASNAFFLIISLLNILGYFAPQLFTVSYVPWGTLMILAFVIAVTLAFEGSDDFERHRADNKTNKMKAREVLSLSRRDSEEIFLEADDGKDGIQERTWGELKPGQIIRVQKGEYVPADILLVNTSTENGMCYVETSGIDGETNLKLRHVPKELKRLAIDSRELEGDLLCEEPNAFLQFSGSLQVKVRGEEHAIAAGLESMILRGSQLRNTAWVDGLIVYAGSETKLIMSSSQTPSKFSRLDTTVNRMIGYLLVVYIAVSITAVALLCAWVPSTTTMWYFRGLDAVNSYVFPGWLAYFFTFSGTFASMIPINLYVCLEIVNFVQARYINWDLNMYDAASDTPASCRTGSLVAEIGQVTHIFSDKTGTLTNNCMRLVTCSIDGRLYGWNPPEPDSNGFEPSPPESIVTASEETSFAAVVMDSDPTSPSETSGISAMEAPKVSAEELFKDLTASIKSDTAAMRFVVALAVCHTVVIDHAQDGSIQYNAEGPDEEALVNAAASIGVRLVNTEGDVYELEMKDADRFGTSKTRRFRIIGVNKFSSSRKRMSVIVEDLESGHTELVIKGADNVMYELASSTFNHSTSKQQVDKHLTRLSLCGLRTLIVGGRTLDASTLAEWKQAFQESKSSIGAARVAAEEKAAAVVERDIDVYGVTGIEDALQEGVPETIEIIRKAGISLWVLTGDKTQTAINIALSARIIDSTMTRILLDEGSRANLMDQMRRTLMTLFNVSREFEATRGGPRNADETDERTSLLTPGIEGGGSQGLESSPDMEGLLARRLSLVISGNALKWLLEKENGNKESQELLLDLASRCSVVLGCRVSPKQKALVVQMVEMTEHKRKYKRPVTLAIGDGANDVAMIQEARVGVGISGHEGLQAVNSSDFAIARFRFLKDLLLVHGRWNYERNSMLVKYITYSWMVLIYMVFVYIFYSMVSGQSIYVNTYYVTLFAWVTNSVITAIAWFQQDVSRSMVFAFPQVYAVGSKNHYMNGRAIFKMCVRATVHSALVIGLVFYTIPDTTSLDTLGTVVYAAVFLVLFARQTLLTMNVNWFIVVCFFLCAVLFFGGLVVCDLLPVLDGAGVALLVQQWSAPLVWSRAFLAAVSMVVCDYVFLGIPRILYPSELQCIREMDRFPRLSKKKKEKGTSLEGEQSESSSEAKHLGRLVRQASTCTPGMQPLIAHKGFAES